MNRLREWRYVVCKRSGNGWCACVNQSLSRSRCFLAPAPKVTKRLHPVIADFINAKYFRPETSNLTLVGLKDPAEADAMVDPDGYFQGVDDNFVLEAGEGLIKRF